MTADAEGKVIYANKSVGRMFGYDAADLVGQPVHLFLPSVERSEHARRLQGMLTTRELRIEGKSRMLHGCRADGNEFPVELTVASWLADGTRYMSAIITDVTERQAQEEKIKAALVEKDILLKEVYHRVKNNMQVIQSLLKMQARGLPEGSSREALAEAGGRVRTMALVHELLYRSRDLTSISVRTYIHDLLRQIAETTGANSRRIAIRDLVEDIELGLDSAIPMGLVINELVTNSLKHGFPDGRTGTITVAIVADQGGALVRISDDGIGLPEGYDIAQGRSMGLQIASSLAKQLGGQLTATSDAGTDFAFRMSIG